MLAAVREDRRDEPVQRARGVRERLGRDRALRGGAQRRDQLFRILDAGAHDEPFFRARHRHVQQAHLLREALACEAACDRGAGERGILRAALEIRDLRAEAEHGMDEHARAALAQVEAVREVAEEHDGEFQALGLVD